VQFALIRSRKRERRASERASEREREREREREKRERERRPTPLLRQARFSHMVEGLGDVSRGSLRECVN
jgi:hypothetical protein